MLAVKRKKLWLLFKLMVNSVWFEVGLMVFLVGIDQFSKWWFQMRDSVVVNSGGFLGVFPDFFWLWLLLLLWLGVLYHWYGHEKSWSRFGLLLILIGGLGNLFDRILFGYVRDFIYYPGFGFYGNIADILLVLGVVISVAGGLLLQYEACEPIDQK